MIDIFLNTVFLMPRNIGVVILVFGFVTFFVALVYCTCICQESAHYRHRAQNNVCYHPVDQHGLPIVTTGFDHCFHMCFAYLFKINQIFTAGRTLGWQSRSLMTQVSLLITSSNSSFYLGWAILDSSLAEEHYHPWDQDQKQGEMGGAGPVSRRWSQRHVFQRLP